MCLFRRPNTRFFYFFRFSCSAYTIRIVRVLPRNPSSERASIHHEHKGRIHDGMGADVCYARSGTFLLSSFARRDDDALECGGCPRRVDAEILGSRHNAALASVLDFHSRGNTAHRPAEKQHRLIPHAVQHLRRLAIGGTCLRPARSPRSKSRRGAQYEYHRHAGCRCPLLLARQHTAADGTQFLFWCPYAVDSLFGHRMEAHTQDGWLDFSRARTSCGIHDYRARLRGTALLWPTRRCGGRLGSVLLFRIPRSRALITEI